MDTWEVVNEREIDIFHVPARLLVSGFSNSGKTELTSKIIRKYHHKFASILICGVTEHSLESDPVIKDKLSLYRDIVDPTSEIDHFKQGGILLVLDDNFIEAINNKVILDCFSKGRHSNISVILITQNLFPTGKYWRSISLNCSHYILLKQRDLQQIECLGRQLYGKEKAKQFTEIYRHAVLNRPYGHLLVDLSCTSDEKHQFRTNIADQSHSETVIQW